MIYLILILYKKAIVNKLSFIFKDDKDMNARCATKSLRATVDHLRAHPSLRVGRCADARSSGFNGSFT